MADSADLIRQRFNALEPVLDEPPAASAAATRWTNAARYGQRLDHRRGRAARIGALIVSDGDITRAMTAHAREYVARKIKQALAHGAKRIDLRRTAAPGDDIQRQLFGWHYQILRPVCCYISVEGECR